MKVERRNEALGEPIEEKTRRYLESNGYSIGLGTTNLQEPDFPNHAHDFNKKDAVVSGRFRIEAEDHEFVLELLTTLKSLAAGQSCAWMRARARESLEEPVRDADIPHQESRRRPLMIHVKKWSG